MGMGLERAELITLRSCRTMVKKALGQVSRPSDIKLADSKPGWC
jgi:hypothetical protein